MMGTEILKIDAEMAEEIEVEVGTFNTEIIFILFCHINQSRFLKLMQFLMNPTVATGCFYRLNSPVLWGSPCQT